MSSREQHGSGKIVKVQKKGKSSKSQVDDVVNSDDVSIVVTGVPEDRSIADRTIAGRTCKSCRGPDNDEMVQCDNCDKWHHFGCVGVSEEVADHSWSCPKCVSAKWAQRSRSTSSKQLQPSDGAKDGMDTRGSQMLKGPREKDQLSSTGDVVDNPIIGLEENDPMDTKSKKRQQASNQTVASSVASSNVSTSSRKSSRTLLKLQMQKLEEEQRLAKVFLDRKYAILEEAASERSSRSSFRASSKNSCSMSRVCKWVNGDNTRRKEEDVLSHQDLFDPDRHSTQRPSMLASLNHQFQDQMTIGRTFSMRAMSSGAAAPVVGLCNSQRSAADRIVNPSLRDRPCGYHQYAPTSNAVGNHHYSDRTQLRQPQSRRETRCEEDLEDPWTLTKKQLAARQAISKDLPNFSGNPEEWPIFLSSYTNTTAMCGFTDAENAVRLQKSLTGKAYAAVKSRLMHPSNVSGVIETLRMRFGQPEAIVHSLIAKITALPSLREDKLETIMDFAVEVQNFCAIVDACELEEHMYNVSLLHQLVCRLPPSIKLDWARYRHTLPRVNLSTFGNWIYSLAEAASTVTIPGIPESKSTRIEPRTAKKNAGFLNAHLEPTEAELNVQFEPARKNMVECPICKSSCNEIEKCKQFLELPRDSRWAVVRDFDLCRRCLGKHNGGCRAKACGIDGCTRKHHELLHNENQSKKAVPTNDISQREEQGTSSARHECNNHSNSNNSLFRYLPVILHGKSGYVQTFAFLDEGSKLTLMDQELADELDLDGVESPLYLRWTGGTERCETDSRVISLSIAGTYDGAKKYNLDEVRTVKELQLPQQSLDVKKMKEQYPYLRKLPIESYDGAQPRILIGLKHAHVSIVLQCREGKLDQPIAIKTRLGWTVCGGGADENAPNMVHYSFHIGSRNDHSDEDLHQAMKEYFTLDSLGVVKSSVALLSTEDQRSCKMLESLTNFNGERYETSLLWRYDDIRLPDSRSMALRRFRLLEKRMTKDPDLAKALNQKIAEYLAKGYIRELTKEEEDRPVSRAWYLPVFPVFNPNKPGKIRIVWDAAATIFGVSLNSVLLKGPDQIGSLFGILLQFREHQIGLTGDIREMFHQIQIVEQDRACQRFFWNNDSGETVVFEMSVMTFGACCSPSTAQFVKNLNAERFIGKFPQAVDAIVKRHYVDDMLVSVKTEEEAVRIAQQVKHIHSQGGFEIRNWISNSPAVLLALGEEDAKIKNLDLSAEMATEKVLGLWWCTEKDTFTYRVGWTRYDEALLTGQRRPTKREVLKVLMSIFDPLGLIAHLLIYLKVLLQEIWRSGTQWDEEINDTLFLKWQTWLRVLPEVESVQIPRCYYPENISNCKVELHTFVDASETGFAAVSYLRFSNGNEVRSILVTAKTRVAPLKFQSIPRLELQAAVLGARLAQTITESLSIQAHRRCFWTDSRDVLCWINSDHRRFTQFVAHRVSELLDTTETSEWRWVPTKQNVADEATKWQGRPDLAANSRWFNGPEFLRRDELDWPQQSQIFKTTLEEIRPHLLAHISTESPALRLVEYSSWKRVVSVIGYLRRFVENCRRKLQHHRILTGSLLMEEIRAAEDFLFRQAQQDTFAEEIATLIQGRQIPRSSSLFKSTPFVDEKGILRVRGRTTGCAFITEETKNPIILPRNHHITTLLISHYHDKYHHLNQETVVNELRQKFSIPRLRVSCSKVRRNCQRCKNDQARPSFPIMADLPDARLAAYSRPFTHVGIDYFGPMEIAIGRRVEKRWGMLATCMTTRAVHIEIAHTLSTDSCVMAIRNMIARRGIPRYIYCDRGTNFVGTSKELSRVEEELNVEVMMKEFTSSETVWSFNPPLSPHMGGCWERLIRSVKNSLKSLKLPRRPTDEVLRNALIEIENTLNSRPLTHVSIEDTAAPALTPNHILLGTSNGTKPLSTMDDSAAAVRQCWRTSQVIANQFWKRWIAEYLPEITRRTKWYNSSGQPVKIGDIVVIVDSTFPRNCWPKGRVIATRPGRDGEVRSATVRTMTGVYERPVIKLAVLDVRREKE